MLGSTTPRLWTPPLRDLEEPGATYGRVVAAFARDVLDHPLDPWQEWLAVHAGEMLADNRTPRFRRVLTLVARQNGKSTLLAVLAAFWLTVDKQPMVLGLSTTANMAKEAWSKAVTMMEQSPDPSLAALRDTPKWKRLVVGEVEAQTAEGNRYVIAAANTRGGRGLTVNRLILDEFREHADYKSWDAATPATAAVSDAQVWAVSNAGSDRSLPLNDLRDSALRYIDTGDGDPRLGLFEWSAPDDSDPLDLDALAQANPNLGRRLPVDALVGEAQRCAAQGGEALAGFRTENMCIRVHVLSSAVDAGLWRACHVDGDLSEVRRRVAMCVDVAPDGQHVSLVAAAVLGDGRVRVEAVRAWEDTDAVRRELPRLVGRVKPRALGWFPSGPAAALAADLGVRSGWPPAGVELDEIRGEVTAVCMGFEEQVRAGRLVHADDPLLNAHVTGAERLRRGDGWVFSRRGEGHCDAAYAAAGAVHLARTLPAPVGRPRLVVAE